MYYLQQERGSRAGRAKRQQGCEGRRGTLEGRALEEAGHLKGRALGEEGHLEGRVLERQGTWSGSWEGRGVFLERGSPFGEEGLQLEKSRSFRKQ